MEFAVGGRRYCLRFTHRAFLALEREHGKRSAEEVFGLPTSAEGREILMHLGLECHRRRFSAEATPYTREDANDILDSMSMQEAVEVLVEALKRGTRRDDGGESSSTEGDGPKA